MAAERAVLAMVLSVVFMLTVRVVVVVVDSRYGVVDLVEFGLNWCYWTGGMVVLEAKSEGSCCGCRHHFSGRVSRHIRTHPRVGVASVPYTNIQIRSIRQCSSVPVCCHQGLL